VLRFRNTTRATTRIITTTAPVTAPIKSQLAEVEARLLLAVVETTDLLVVVFGAGAEVVAGALEVGTKVAVVVAVLAGIVAWGEVTVVVGMGVMVVVMIVVGGVVVIKGVGAMTWKVVKWGILAVIIFVSGSTVHSRFIHLPTASS
jgi:hypothetical protein